MGRGTAKEEKRETKDKTVGNDSKQQNQSLVLVEKQNSDKRPAGFTYSRAGVRNEKIAADDLTANEQTLW